MPRSNQACINNLRAGRIAAGSMAAMLVGIAAAPAAAQCDRWMDSPGLHAPFQSGVSCVTTFTPPGSSVARLIVGSAGQSIKSGGADLTFVAQFDGTNWQSVGGGVSRDVQAVAAWNSPSGAQLVVGGSFVQAGGINAAGIAAWDGSLWHTLGTGIMTGAAGYGVVSSMISWDPDGAGPAAPLLIAAGGFDHAGGLAVSNIAAWDGSIWHALGGGVNNVVGAVTTWDPDGSGPLPPQLIVGGDITIAGGIAVNSIARWDGTAWRALGLGLQGPSAIVNDLISWDPDGSGPLNPVLVATGNFTTAGGIPAAGVAYWDGTSWHAMSTPPGSELRGLSVWDPDGSGPQPAQLVAGGRFGAIFDPISPTPRTWNGSSWQQLGSDIREPSLDRFVSWDPDGSGPQPPQLVGAGYVNDSTPTGYAMGALRLVGSDWTSLNTTSPAIYAAQQLNGRLVYGGHFESYTNGTGGTPDAFSLAQWDGVGTTSVGGTNGGVSGAVRALKSFAPGISSTELVVGGTFSSAAGVTVSNIAHYIDSVQTGQSGWFPMSQGFNDTVYAIERFNNATYAGGAFSNSGGTTTLNHIARWSGAAWQPLGSAAAQGINGTVYALRTYNGSLYAGGSFTSAVNGTLDSGALARWNGTSWSIVVGHFGGTIYALEVFNNELIIGGDFAEFGTTHNIAKYNSVTNAYTTLGVGSANLPVRALCVGSDGLLYVGGDFTAITGMGVNNLARWDGTSWSEVRGGTSGPIYGLQAFHNELHVFGTFGKAAYSTIPAPAWARYTIDGVPWIAAQPVDYAANCVGQDVYVNATLAPGYSPFTVAWRHNGTPLANGPTPWGSTIELTPFGYFTIHNIAPLDAGLYDAEFSTSCGNVTSTVATITVCYANCDCSSVAPTLNVLDFSCFLNRFAAGDPYANCDNSTQPPVLNVLDFSCFLNKFAAGCP